MIKFAKRSFTILNIMVSVRSELPVCKYLWRKINSLKEITISCISISSCFASNRPNIDFCPVWKEDDLLELTGLLSTHRKGGPQLPPPPSTHTAGTAASTLSIKESDHTFVCFCGSRQTVEEGCSILGLLHADMLKKGTFWGGFN